LILLYDDFMDL